MRADSEARGNGLIVLWAHPRALSTAFERMMIQRGDFQVLHEPFCAVADTGAAIVEEGDGGGAELQGCNAVMDYVLAASRVRQVFVKETTERHHVSVLGRRDFMRAASHTILIRDPAAAIPSHFAVNERVSLEEFGYRNLYLICEAVYANGSNIRAVMQAEELLKNPLAVIAAYCQSVGIPFIPEALTWEPGLRKEWSRTARWHVDVAASSGFRARDDSTQGYDRAVSTLPFLREALAYHFPFYLRLRSLCARS